ncbi:MAG: hypothetical protein JSR77_04415 [Planctomycetes bacterium]|nr:hypothetical protein [Planctomycetota bacterium]
MATKNHQRFTRHVIKGIVISQYAQAFWSGLWAAVGVGIAIYAFTEREALGAAAGYASGVAGAALAILGNYPVREAARRAERLFLVLTLHQMLRVVHHLPPKSPPASFVFKRFYKVFDEMSKS